MRQSLTIIMAATCCCATANAQTYRQQGIGYGGLTGAVIGGIIGHQNDEVAEGALIGGAIGAVTGGVIGNQRDQYQQAWSYSHAVPAYQAVPPSVVTPNDVLMMTRSGISDPVIINHVRTKGISHSLAVHDIISLHQQGVSESVITAMQTAPVAGTTVVARPSGPRASTVIVTPPARTPHPYHRHCHPYRRCW